MTFSNPIVAGEELIRSAIRSENYVSGGAGWRIARDGNAEFGTVTARGTISSVGATTTARLSSGSLIIEDNANPVTLSRLTINTLEFQDGASNEKGNVEFDDGIPLIGFTTPITSGRGVFLHGTLGYFVSTSDAFNTVETWTGFTFAAGWADTAVPCKYYKDPNGRVWLRGGADHTAAGVPGDGSLVTTLPVGYRPAQYTLIPNAYDASATKGRVQIDTDGTVRVFDAPNDLPFFDGISFSVF